MSDRDDLTPRERADLEALRVDGDAPAELEERVVARLRAGGMIGDDADRAAGSGHARTAGSGPNPRLMRVASVVMLLGAAFFAGRATVPRSALLMEQPLERTWAFLVYRSPQAMLLPPSQTAYDETSRWIATLRAPGEYRGGAQLETRALQVRRAGERTVTDEGPPGEATRVLTGFLLIRAADERRAREIVAASPLLEHGYTIEVREIIPD